jgi:hypothetical protein
MASVSRSEHCYAPSARTLSPRMWQEPAPVEEKPKKWPHVPPGKDTRAVSIQWESGYEVMGTKHFYRPRLPVL